MLYRGARWLSTSARRWAAESVADVERANRYGIAVSKVQGVVDSFTGGNVLSFHSFGVDFRLAMEPRTLR